MTTKKIIEEKLSVCCNARLIGGVQCETCGADGRKFEKIIAIESFKKEFIVNGKLASKMNSENDCVVTPIDKKYVEFILEWISEALSQKEKEIVSLGATTHGNLVAKARQELKQEFKRVVGRMKKNMSYFYEESLQEIVSYNQALTDILKAIEKRFL